MDKRGVSETRVALRWLTGVLVVLLSKRKQAGGG